MARTINGGYGWVVVLASFLCSVINDGIMYTLGEFITDIDAELEGGKGYTSSIITIMEFTCYMIGPLANGLTQVYGARAVTVTGSALATIGLLIGSVAQSIPVLILGIGLFTGSGFGLIYLSQLVILTEYFTTKLGVAIGVSVCGTGLGMMSFGPLVARMIKDYGWHETLYYLGLINSSTILCGLIFAPGPLKESAKPEEKKTEEVAIDEKVCSTEVRVSFEETKEEVRIWQKVCSAVKESFDFSLLLNGAFVVYGLGCFLNNLGYYVPTTFMAERAEDLEVANSITASYLYIYLGVGNVITRSLAGVLTLWMPENVRFILLNIAIAVYGLAITLSSLCVTYASLVLYAVVIGISEGIFITLGSVVMVDLFGVEQISSAFGINSLFNGVGALFGPIMVGYLKDVSGSYDIGYYAAGGAVMLNSLLYLCIPFIKRNNV